MYLEDIIISYVKQLSSSVEKNDGNLTNIDILSDVSANV